MSVGGSATHRWKRPSILVVGLGTVVLAISASLLTPTEATARGYFGAVTDESQVQLRAGGPAMQWRTPTRQTISYNSRSGCTHRVKVTKASGEPARDALVFFHQDEEGARRDTSEGQYTNRRGIATNSGIYSGTNYTVWATARLSGYRLVTPKQQCLVKFVVRARADPSQIRPGASTRVVGTAAGVCTTVDGGHPEHPVALQKNVNGEWRTLGRKNVYCWNTVSFRVSPQGRGYHKYRLLAYSTRYNYRNADTARVRVG